MYKYFACIDRFSYLAKPLFTYVSHEDEQISDSYSQGIQGRTLLHSFRSYIDANRELIVADPEVLSAYLSILRGIQFRNVVKKVLPQFLLDIYRRYRRIKNKA